MFTMEMIQSSPLSSQDAKALLVGFMQKTGTISATDISRHSAKLEAEIQQHEFVLESEISDIAVEVNEYAIEVSSIREAVQNKTGSDREQAVASFEDSSKEALYLVEELEARKADLKAFKADKSEFLVDYINQLTEALR